MTYTPRFQEIFESVVLDNILAIVKRDMKSALDYFYASDNLLDFAQRTLGNFIRESLPAFAVEVDRGADNESADGSYVGPQLRLFLYVAVGDADPTETTRKLEKYMRAVRSILKTASTADYMAGITAPTIGALVRDLSWQYGEISKNANLGLWMKPATFELVLKYIER